MAKVKKTIELSLDDFDDIIISFGISRDYMKESVRLFDDPVVKKHFRNVANKYDRRMVKYTKIRNELFGWHSNPLEK